MTEDEVIVVYRAGCNHSIDRRVDPSSCPADHLKGRVLFKNRIAIIVKFVQYGYTRLVIFTTLYVEPKRPLHRVGALTPLPFRDPSWEPLVPKLAKLTGTFPETGWLGQSAPIAVGSSVLVAPLSARLVFPLRLLCVCTKMIIIVMVQRCYYYYVKQQRARISARLYFNS